MQCMGNKENIMKYDTECPSCKKVMEITDEMLGTIVECPFCKAAVQLPAPKSPPPPLPRTQSPTYKQCDYCGETILFKAKKCKHCGEFVTGQAGGKTVHKQPGSNSVTTQLTSKKLKIQIIYSVSLFWLGLIGCCVAAHAEYNIAAYIFLLCSLIGAIWHIATKVSIWWNHK